MGEHPELDLGVVGRDQQPAGAGDERPPDALAPLGADGDVLQVGIRRRQPTGRRHRLVERGVHPAVLVAEERESVHVGALELGELAPFEHQVDHRVLLPERLQAVGVGAPPKLGLAPGGKSQLVVEDGGELLGATEVEGVAGAMMDLVLQLPDSRLHLGGDGDQRIAVEEDAHPLHLGEDGDERQLQLVEEL